MLFWVHHIYLQCNIHTIATYFWRLNLLRHILIFSAEKCSAFWNPYGIYSSCLASDPPLQNTCRIFIHVLTCKLALSNLGFIILMLFCFLSDWYTTHHYCMELCGSVGVKLSDLDSLWKLIQSMVVQWFVNLETEVGVAVYFASSTKLNKLNNQSVNHLFMCLWYGDSFYVYISNSKWNLIEIWFCRCADHNWRPFIHDSPCVSEEINHDIC